MGKLSGLFTTAVFVGLVALLIYFCCRVKRKPGTIVQQRSAMEFNAQPVQPITPSVYPGGLSGYPHVVQQSSYPPTTTYGQGYAGYPPVQSSERQQNSNHFSYATGNPPNSNAAYPPMPPYPTAGGGGISMPMPMPMPNNSRNVQPGAPSHFPTAPTLEPEDLPPPYESVVRQS